MAINVSDGEGDQGSAENEHSSRSQEEYQVEGGGRDASGSDEASSSDPHFSGE